MVKKRGFLAIINFPFRCNQYTHHLLARFLSRSWDGKEYLGERGERAFILRAMSVYVEEWSGVTQWWDLE